MTDELITDHPYQGELRAGASCQHMHDRTHPLQVAEVCGRQAMDHAGAYQTNEQFAQTKAELSGHLIHTHPHDFEVLPGTDPVACGYTIEEPRSGGVRVCGHQEAAHGAPFKGVAEAVGKAIKGMGALVRAADVAQYQRPAMPDAARKGIVVTLIDAPVDPLGTLAVIGGIYTGNVARSKAEVTDDARRSMLDDMQQTVLNGPLESIQFTFLVEGVDRAITHQMVRNRFAFFAQESLRFAVAEDWAQEVPLPPSLRSLPDDGPAVGVWRKALNQAEDSYAALIGAGMPAEEARGVLPHAITTRLYWTVSLRTLLQEAGKRTCTQAQFPWRELFGGVAKAFRERAVQELRPGYDDARLDEWQYTAFADLIRPVCYQDGKCGFMAKFDRGCTIRERVDANERAGRPSSFWGLPAGLPGSSARLEAINPAEWIADPAAARVTEVGE